MILLIIIGFLLSGGRGALAVDVADIKKGDITKTTLSSGLITAPSDSSIISPLSGQIASVNFKDGDAVKAGQVIFTFREDQLLSSLRQAESAYAQAKQAKELVTRGAPTDLQLATAQTALDAAQGARDRAKSTYDSANTDLNKAAYDQAEVAYQQARVSLETLQRQQPTALSVQAADAAVAATLAALKQAQVDYSRRGIVAPNDGILALGTSQTGDQISTGSAVVVGQTIAQVIGAGAVEFVADMDESDIVRLSSGQTVSVTPDAFSGQSFAGKITRLPARPITNATGGTIFQVGIALDQQPTGLRVGLRGQVTVVLETVKDVLEVPTAALVTKEGKTFVWLVENGQAKRRDVTIGLESSTDAQVTDGLSLADRVIVSTNIRDVKEGLSVTVKN